MKQSYRYWCAGLILLMVAIHAAVIGYVRIRVARLSVPESTVVEVGQFRFQPVSDTSRVYHFRLHAVIDPTRFHQGRDRLAQRRMEIVEASEQLLRQVDTVWLNDPSQTHLRDRLMSVVLEHLDEPLVQRMLITDWLQVPVNSISLGSLAGELASN